MNKEEMAREILELVEEEAQTWEITYKLSDALEDSGLYEKYQEAFSLAAKARHALRMLACDIREL
jgi:uncharacterized protein YjgD (DUF1641 family)